MEYKLLGPLEVDDGTATVALGPPRQRALLARLLLDAGRAIPLEHLIDDLWGEDAPASASKMVQIYVSQLRKVLPPASLRTQGRGYVLDLGEAQLDLRRFEALRAGGRVALDRADAGEAVEKLRGALALWRGPALGEFDEPFARSEGNRLEELRLSCLEERFEAELAAGHHYDAAAELESLVARQPLRERPHRQLMLALYRCGRQADALAVYRDFRRRLDTELGPEPSEQLRELEPRILQHDAALAGPRAAPTLAPAPPPPTAAERRPAGRAAELEVLHRALAEVTAGARRTLFITGEAGIGQTTVVEAFLAEARALVGRGQCLENYGAGEAYLPVFDALEDLAAEGIAPVLAARAPTWLAHLPWLAGPDDDLADRTIAVTPERMLREMLLALEEIARARPVVLVLEDLQWSDAATLDLVSALVHRRSSARLMLVGTYRWGEAVGGTPVHTLARELYGARLAAELPVGPLDPGALAAWLAERLPRADLPTALAGLLPEGAAGNPLFAELLVAHWGAEGRGGEEEGVMASPERLASGLPATLRDSILDQLRELDELDGDLLYAAAVAGPEFAAGAVAAAMGREEAAIDARCRVLARRRCFLERRGETYAFVHDLHREVLVGLVAPDRRAALHGGIGAWLEDVHAEHLVDHAPELAFHYVEANEPERAVRYLELAAEHALARSAW